MAYTKVAPGSVKAVYALEQYVRASQLEPALIEPVKLRASLINGCAYCVEIHSKDARAKGGKLGDKRDVSRCGLVLGEFASGE